MTEFVSPRRWPDSLTIGSYAALEPLLDRYHPQIAELLAGAVPQVRVAELDATVEPLEDGDLPDSRYAVLSVAGRRVPIRLTGDGRLRIGLAGESTNTVFDLISRMLAAEPVHTGAEALAFAGRVYQDLRGIGAAEIAEVAGCPLCDDAGGQQCDATFARCAGCGVLYRPEPDESGWRDVYADGSGAYFNGLTASTGAPGAHGYEDYEEWARVILGREHFDRRARWIQAATGERSGRSLEIGCATGEMTAAMARAGWQAAGTDLSGYCVDRAAALHPDSRFSKGTLQDCDGGWDLIGYYDVFEHLADPIGELRDVRRRLRPGGWIVLELPNQGSAEAEICGLDYLFGEHLFYYDAESSSRALERAGFQVVAVTSSHDAYFRVDRIAGEAVAADLIAGHRGERLLVLARRPG